MVSRRSATVLTNSFANMVFMGIEIDDGCNRGAIA